MASTEATLIQALPAGALRLLNFLWRYMVLMINTSSLSEFDLPMDLSVKIGGDLGIEIIEGRLR